MINPYAPPAAPQAPAIENRPQVPRSLASLGKRFGGSLIDRLLAFVAGVVLSHLYARLTGHPRTEQIIGVGMLAAMVANWSLVAVKGQTVGKMLLRTRIVLADGSNPGVVRGVVLRALPLACALAVPIVLGMSLGARLFMQAVFFVDALFIFAAGAHRCVHDRLAGTWVVDVGSR